MSDSQVDSQPSQSSTATVTESHNEVLYFAYGSNLSTAQMLRRCPDSMPIGLGFLHGYRWIVNERGYANVIISSHTTTSPSGLESVGQEEDGVFGLMYLLNSDDEATLDFYEGVPTAYKKVVRHVIRVGDENGREIMGQPCQALVYVDDQRVEGDRAKEEYKVRMEDGIAEAVETWGLEEGYAESMRKWLRE